MSDGNVKVRVNNGGSGCGCFGCLGFIAFCVILWALVFGVTIGGRHYGMSCSMEHGVQFE